MITLAALESLMLTHQIISQGKCINPGDSLESLGLDSLDLTELAMRIDIETGFETTPGAEQSWITVADVLTHYQS
jgi:acyl carrier protein